MTQLLPRPVPLLVQEHQLPPLRASEVGDALTRVVLGIHLNGLTLSAAARSFEKRFIECVLDECAGNQSLAADQLGMHRNTLSRKIAELRIHTWKFNRAGTRRLQRQQLYASKERAATLGGDHSRRSALAPVRTAHGPREVNAPDAGLPPASAVFTNSVRKGGRGESPEPSRGGDAHLAQGRMPPRVDSFDRDDVECGGLKA